MDVVLGYKWGRDPDESRVKEDGTVIIVRDRLVASDDDAAAVKVARQLAQQTEGTIVGATIGSGDVSWAMARGVSKAVSADSLMPSVNDLYTAKALAKTIQSIESYDVVILGDPSDASGVCPAIASYLGIPAVVGVSECEIDPSSDKHLIVKRKENRRLQTLRVALPALIGITAEEDEKGVPSIKEMLAARKAPVDKIDAEVVETCTIEKVSSRCPESHKAQLFEGDFDKAAADLVALLRSESIL